MGTNKTTDSKKSLSISVRLNPANAAHLTSAKQITGLTASQIARDSISMLYQAMKKAQKENKSFALSQLK
jgi:hypothetical protein